MLNVVDPRVEYINNPINISAAQPRFSWKIHTDKTNLLQTVYIIEVAADADFISILWNSGAVNSEESHLVSYDGPKLVSSSRYFWRVKIKDNQGEESPWSETAFFETTILDNSEWQAVFISGEDVDAGESSAAHLFRNEFIVSGKIKSARLYASGKGIYIAYLNGKKAGNEYLSTGWTEYKHRLLFQSYDVTSLISNGTNVIGMAVGPGWYKGDLAGWLAKRNVYGSQTAVIAQLRLEYDDGKLDIISTNSTWKSSNAPVTYSELYNGETYDARLEQHGWNRAGFNESSWKPVIIESKDISILKPHDGVPVKEHEVFKPVSIFKTPEGDTVIDFGQNISGWVCFKVKGNAGDHVKLRHAETLDARGNFYTLNLRKAKQAIEYYLSGKGEETYSPYFTFQGFRYIAVDTWPGEISIDNFEARAIYSDIRSAGKFNCSHPLLNQFFSNVLWSMKGNFVDIPTDCPQRDERLGWTGDAHVFLYAANYLMETAPFFKKWLRDLAVSQLPDGQVPHVVPDVLFNISTKDKLITGDAGASGWADGAVGIPWFLYIFYGDRNILEEQYPSMKKWVDYIHKVAQDGTLFNVGFHFGDWVAIDAKEGSHFGATPNDLIATAFYAYSANLLAKTAAVLEKKEDAEKYTELYREIRKAFRNEFFTPNGRLVARTQTAHILSLAFDLTPCEYRMRTINTLVEIIAEHDNHLTTGFLGTPYICQVLTDNGYVDLAYELLLKEDYPSWLYQITKGATTVWEHWDGLKPDGTMWNPSMNSFNHYAYGAVCDWVFRSVGGLDTDHERVAFKRAIMRPLIASDAISWAETSYESVYGQFYIRWEKKEKEIQVNVSVPPNTTAILTLPLARAGLINGINFIESSGGAVSELGSGLYTFIYPAV